MVGCEKADGALPECKWALYSHMMVSPLASQEQQQSERHNYIQYEMDNTHHHRTGWLKLGGTVVLSGDCYTCEIKI